MTALRPTTFALLLLACSSSSQPLPGDAGTATADGSPTSSVGGSDGPAAADAPMSSSAPEVSPDTAGATLAEVGANAAAEVGVVEVGVVEVGVVEVGTNATPEAGACKADPGVYGPFASCGGSVGVTCDPVCQARCGCGQRCVVDQSGPHCQTQAEPFVDLGGTCNPKDDRCKPGLLCLQESADVAACGAHCYQHCRVDGDCAKGAKCVIQVQFGASAIPHRLCSPPPDSCDPWGPARCRDQAQRPAPLFGCYVMGSNTNAAACECAGTLKVGAPCMYEHECEPGAECVLDGGTRSCRKVCNADLVVGPNPGPCPVGQSCVQFPGSAKYGFCK